MLIALAAVMLASPLSVRAAGAGEIVVFAAASLKTALDEIAAAWTSKTGNVARISYAGSARLARQIQHGAPADIFMCANAEWMDVLQADKLIDPATRRDLLRNEIVLVAHGRNAEPLELAKGFDLARLLGDGRLAMAMVDAVPAGLYGKAALTSLGIWESVASKVAQTDNVRAALALVARNEAPYGIVYATDAAASDNVTVVATFPLDTHPPIVYPAAMMAESARQDLARAFLGFLQEAQAKALFEKQGFGVIDAIPAQ